MEFFEVIIDTLVMVMGFVSWIFFTPQIKLLLEIKNSESLSLWLLWGSVGMQGLALTQLILKKNWPLTIMFIVGLICLGTIIVLTYRYRKYPGGKTKSNQ